VVTTRRRISIAAVVMVAGLGALCYQALRAGATAPVAVVPAYWEARLTLTNGLPRVHVEMTGTVLRASRELPACIPVFPRDTVFKDLRFNGAPHTPRRDGDWFVVEQRKPGAFTVSVTLDIKPASDKGTHHLGLHRPPFVESLLAVDSMQAWDVAIDGVVGRIVGTPDVGTHGRLALGDVRSLTVSWQHPRPAVSRRGTPSVTPSIVWSVGPRVLSARGRFLVVATGGPISRVTFALGAGADHVQVKGGAIREYRLADGSLDIFFSRPLSGATRVEISYSLPRPKGNLVDCRAPQPVGGRRVAGGWMMVVNDSDGILLEHDTAGVRPVSDLDVPPAVMGLVAGKPILFYECVTREASVVLDVVTATPFPVVDTIADRADSLCVVRPGGEEVTRLSYRIRNNRKQFLRMRLPADVTLLRVEVENQPRRMARDGDDVLIPLVTSIQTLGGLVAFPVEIIYFRQGDPAVPRGKRRMDLPELDGVPVTVVNATVMFPGDTTLRSYASTLRRVDSFTHAREARFVEQINDLGFNYYRAGYEAYRNNELEAAETFLGHATKLTGNTSYSEDAKNLMWNIRIGRGEVARDADREERAKVARIQEGLSGQNTLMAQEQEAMIDVGLANLAEGDEEMGLELLKEARSLGGKLLQRGASNRRQSAVTRQFESQLKVAQEARDTNVKLQQELETLQHEAAQIVQAQPASSLPGQQAGQFAAALYEAAGAQGLSLSDAQNAAFGDVGNVAGNKKPVRVSQSAKARQHQREVKQKRAHKVSVSSKGQRATQGSLSTRNDWLARQVSTLKQAVQTVKQAPDSGALRPASGRGQAAADWSEVRRQVEQAGDEVRQLVADLDDKRAEGVAMNDIAVRRRLEALQTWTYNNKRTVGQADDTVGQGYTDLEVQIAGAMQKAAEQTQKRMNASRVLIDLADVVDADVASDQEALLDFIGNNYVSAVTNGQSQFSIQNGQLAVVNAYNNSDVLNDVVGNLRDNGGQVVTVAGRELSTAALANVSGAADWFTQRTIEGRPYAILDEAQYRALANGAAMLDPNVAARHQDQRDVVVGTPNRVAGQALTLEASDGLVNTMALGGSTVALPVDRYAVVNNGTSLSVIKAGEVRGWQDEALRPVEVAVEARFDLELPAMGVALRFEKMLLAAGESADIEVQL
jgi:hypothetical protein